MDERVKEILELVIEREGGYVNHPADRGGPTKYGITQKTLSAYFGRPASIDDVKNLTRDTAHKIYYFDYAAPFTGIESTRVLDLIIDCAVNHGTSRAKQWLQWAARVKVDSIVGPRTLAAVNESPRAIYVRLLSNRMRFFGEIVRRDKSQSAFISGWLNRLSEFFPALEAEL